MPRNKDGLKPPWKPGESGNPEGRKTAGATIKEWINALTNETEPELRRISKDVRLAWSKRAAANRILRTIEMGDIADMEPWLRGEMSMGDLRQGGVNTELVKKARVKRIPTQNGDGEEREIELYNRAGEDFDRIMDRTEGKPSQAISMNANIEVKSEPVVLVHTAPPPVKPNGS